MESAPQLIYEPLIIWFQKYKVLSKSMEMIMELNTLFSLKYDKTFSPSFIILFFITNQ